VGYQVPLGAQFLQVRPIKLDGTSQTVFVNLNGNASLPNLGTMNGSGSFPIGELTSFIVDGLEQFSFVRTGVSVVFVCLVVYSA
jgi:hypothetical protein